MGQKITHPVRFDGRTEKIDINLEGVGAPDIHSHITNCVLKNEKWKLDENLFGVFVSYQNKNFQPFFSNSLGDMNFLIKGRFELNIVFDGVEKSVVWEVSDTRELIGKIGGIFNLNNDYRVTVVVQRDGKTEEFPLEKFLDVLDMKNKLLLKVYNNYNVACEQDEVIKKTIVYAHDYNDFHMKILTSCDEKTEGSYLNVHLMEKWVKIKKLEKIVEQDVDTKIIRPFKAIFKDGFDSLF